MSDTETDVFVTPCRICGESLGVVVPPEDSPHRHRIEEMARNSAVHDECLTRARAKAEADEIVRVLEARMEAFHRFCPSEFRKPLDPQAKGYQSRRFAAVMDWKFGAVGLLLVGPSGHCKTRFCWQLLWREFQAGRNVFGITHAEFRSKITALASGDQVAANKWLNQLAGFDILLLDDLGKGRVTPAAEEGLFNLLDKRVSECRPVLLTMNTDLDGFAQKCSEEYRGPIIRRITEGTKILKF